MLSKPRLVIFIIFIALMTLSFIACSKDTKDLKIALDIEDQDRYDELFDYYESTTGVTISATYGEDISKLIGTKNEPDIIKTSTVIVDSMKDSLVNLNTYLDKDETISKDEYIDSMIDALTIDGGLYALPTSINTSLLYYNKTLFDESESQLREAFNLDEDESVYPKATWTLDDFKKAALILTKYSMVNGQPLYSQFGADTQLRWWGEWLVYLYHFGGSFYVSGSENHRVALTTKQAIDATEFFVNQSMGDVSEKFAPDAIELSSHFSFLNGNIAMIFGGHMGDWFGYDTIGLDWDIQVLPTSMVNPDITGGEISADAFGISIRSQNKAAAFEFLKLWAGELGSEILYKNGKIGALKSMDTIINDLSEEDQLSIQVSVVFDAIDKAIVLPKEKDFSKVLREMVMTELYKLMYEGRGSENDIEKVLADIEVQVNQYYQGIYE